MSSHYWFYFQILNHRSRSSSTFPHRLYVTFHLGHSDQCQSPSATIAEFNRRILSSSSCSNPRSRPGAYLSNQGSTMGSNKQGVTFSFRQQIQRERVIRDIVHVSTKLIQNIEMHSKFKRSNKRVQVYSIITLLKTVLKDLGLSGSILVSGVPYVSSRLNRAAREAPQNELQWFSRVTDFTQFINLVLQGRFEYISRSQSNTIFD